MTIEERQKYNKQWRLNNKDKLKKYSDKWKEYIKRYGKQWQLDNKDKLKKYRKQYISKHKEHRKQYRKQYRLNNIDKLKKYYKLYNHKNKEKIKYNTLNYNLRKLYGITIDEYEEKLLEQCGNCAICNRPSSDYKRRLHVDHNHITGKIRGLLCVKCNNGLGCFGEEVSILNNAIKYLNK